MSLASLPTSKVSFLNPPVNPPNKIGKFSFTFDLVREHWPELVQIMSGVVVIEASTDIYSKKVNYRAFSELFDEVDNSMTDDVPEYTVETVVHRDGHGRSIITSIKWKRLQKI